MKSSVWVMVFFLVEMACMGMAAVFLVMGELFWGVLMLLCVAGCSFLIFAEGYERGWDSAKGLRMETMEILCRADALLSLGEDMFWGMREIAGEEEQPHGSKAEEETAV